MPKLVQTIKNVVSNVVEGVKNFAKGNFAGVIGNIKAGVFGQPVPGQSDALEANRNTAIFDLARGPFDRNGIFRGNDKDF